MLLHRLDRLFGGIVGTDGDDLGLISDLADRRRLWVASGGHHLHDQIPIGDHAEQPTLPVTHGQRAEVLLRHHPGGFADRRVRRDPVGVRRHDLSSSRHGSPPVVVLLPSYPYALISNAQRGRACPARTTAQHGPGCSWPSTTPPAPNGLGRARRERRARHSTAVPRAPRI